MKKLKYIILLYGMISFTAIWAEDDLKNEFNPLLTGVPSLTIAPDARGGSLGDAGVATDPDMASQYWNPAKYAFAYSKAGLQLSYTPWLRQLVNDIYLAYLSGYYKLGSEDRHALGASLRYFSIGEITMTGDNPGEYMGTISPYEMALDLSYSLKLSEKFSGAVAFRFIYSDLGTGYTGSTADLRPGSSFGVDIAGFYSSYVMMGRDECLLGLGFNISNIGPKISYDGGNTANFLPTNFRLGASFLFPLDDYNTLSLNLDANKLLVPTPPNTQGITNSYEIDSIRNEYKAISPISGIFRSFVDAPGGVKEEFQEISWSLGAEYSYDQKFFVRGGYFYEHPNKGNRQYFSFGAGFKLNVFQLDAAYLVSTVPSNPLDQTLRFSLIFDMDGLKGLVR